MKITDINIVGELERLAAAFPWDTVEIQIDRTPEGEYSFWAWLKGNSAFGFESDLERGESPSEAVDGLINKYAGKRDPEIRRTKKIAELQAQIEKLQAVVIGLPPYIPNRELVEGQPAIRANETITV